MTTTLQNLIDAVRKHPGLSAKAYAGVVGIGPTYARRLLQSAIDSNLVSVRYPTSDDPPSVKEHTGRPPLLYFLVEAPADA
jgi:predicted ArsR family transcriptional regulator